VSKSELREEVRLAKINLYRLLLALPVNEVTDQEARLGYELARDAEIQVVLDKAMEAKNTEVKREQE
jgi:hypothetical protein